MQIKMSSEKQIINQVVRTAGFLVILILVSGDFSILKGFLFALAISMLMFFRMASTTKKAMDLPEHRVRSYLTTQYTIRYAIYAVVLAVAIMRKDMDFTGAVIGLLTVKIGLVSWAVWRMILDIYKSKFKKLS